MRHKLTRAIRPLIILTLIAIFASPAVDTQSQSPPLDIPPNLASAYESDALIIQFAPHTQMRQTSKGSTELPIDRTQQVSAADVSALQSISAGGDWHRSHSLAEEKLDTLWQAARAKTSEVLPDPNNRYRLQVSAEDDLTTTAQQLNSLSSVEAVYFIPKPVLPPSSIDYSEPGNITGNVATDSYQGYLDPAPNGVDARWSWLGMGGRGDGMRICDVEYDYNPNHADLPDITYVGAPKATSEYGPNHGTAVFGELGGRNNGVGVTGIAYNAQFYFAAAKTTTGGYDVGAAVLECADALNPGDVILIEQQTSGPNATGAGQAGLVPVEWHKPWYDDIKTAVAAGMIVVEAAGNGNEDLDDSIYSTGHNGHHPFLPANDSGAIIVGSANPPNFGANARARRPSSNYGSTVDLQGWGTGIVTTGYGTLFPGGNSPDANQENQWYASSFGGTSGASPIVAASAAIVQRNWELTHGGTPASPAQIMQILQDTGTPQNGTDNIGPQPNLRAAILQVLGDQAPTISPPTITPPSGSYQMPIQVTIGYGSGQSGDDTNIRYTLNGSEPTPDSFIFIPEQGDSIYLNYGVTVKAKAFQFHAPTQRVYESETATVTYISSTPKVETPVISPEAGTYNQPHQVTITTNTPGAEIRYRTDGRSPSFFYPGTVYDGPITLDPGDYEVTARGYKDGYYKSDVAYSGDITVNPLQLPPPTIYPTGGTFNGQVNVYLGSTILGADVRYTTDGSTPAQDSLLFSEPLVFTATTTLRARAFLEDYTPSEIAEETYFVTAQAPPPTIIPNGGEFTGSAEVTMSIDHPNATIRYTTNGAQPTSYSTIYSGPFTLGIGEHIVKARGFLPGTTGSGTTESDPFIVYSPDLETVEAPIINPNGGNHTGMVTVTLSSRTEDATIRYTFDPLSNENTWTDYSEPFTLLPDESAQVIRAKAYKTGMADSDFSQTSFNVFDPSQTGTVEVPDLTPPSGTYNNVVQVTVDGHTNPPFTVRQLHITTDGSEPRPNSNTGNGESSPRSLTISESTTVKALASQLGWYNSDIVTREYILECATPEIETTDAPPDAKTVSITTVTENATVRYTTDGTPVDESSTEYTAPFDVGLGVTTVNARCFRSGFDDSETATEVILVEQSVAPSIIQQPQGASVDAGVDISLTVVVTGVPSPDVQWQFEGVDIAGENEPVLEIPAVRAANAGAYQAIARNTAGEETSDAATVSVNSSIAPTGLSIDTSSPTHLGNPTFFATSVEAGSEITYSWTFGDEEMSVAASEFNGGSTTGQSVSHTYTAQGVYTASVTATNEIGTASVSVQIEIIEPLQTATPTDEPTQTPGPGTPTSDPGETTTPTTGTPDPSGTPIPSGTPVETPTAPGSTPGSTSTPPSGTPDPNATPTAPSGSATPQGTSQTSLYLPFVAED